ncbi:tripartite tricarboxylate transporter permease [Afipia sp. DC4300-2b1]|uniref:tripartite tricarboxylate transporter permease n=1 Tax=Afipia sp. DC4300-2b1 TaxID=2804672 RepID=UPI003CFACC5D
MLDNLALGFSVATTPANLAFAFLGCLLGTLIGVLPGIGPVATMAMLLPITYSLSPVAALIMLAGIYYGSQYGGSTTAILLNLPGESSSVVTALDGHAMARDGRAGIALAVAAIGSFVAGSFGTLALAAFGPVLAGVAQKFGAPEYFSLMLFGLVCATLLAAGDFVKAIAMVIVGLLMGIVGTDVNSGASRLTFGATNLSEGIDFVIVALSFFGLAEVIGNLVQHGDQHGTVSKVGRLMPSAADLREAAPAMARGTILGSILGLLPGGGAVLSSFASYMFEKRISKTPERFGRGAIEGVAGPESANNAGAQTSFIPLLTLGIPSNAVMALMMGAMMIQGIAPGSAVMATNPTLFWGMVASMWIGNLMLLIINLPLVGLWVKLLSVPYRILYPCIVMFCCIGLYSLNTSSFDVYLASALSVIGYVLIRLGCEGAPLILGFILGPLLEENLRRSLVLSQGSPSIFIERPISATFLALILVMLALFLLPSARKQREEAFQE